MISVRSIGLRFLGGSILFCAWMAWIPNAVEASADTVRGRLICESQQFTRTQCSTGGFLSEVQLVQRHSEVLPDGRGRCELGETWGFTEKMIWVDNGCIAEFSYVSSTHPPKPVPPPENPPVPYPPESPEPPDHPANLVCRTNGDSFQPYDLDRSRAIGLPGYGYRYPNECEEAVRASRFSHQPVVCNWNGYSFQPYSVSSNRALGFPRTGFRFSNECNQSVMRGANGLVCNFNGSGWTPYQVENGRPAAKAVGGTHFGFARLAECFDEVRLVKNDVLCSWTGVNWQPYFIPLERPVGIPDYGFRALNDCRHSVRLSRRGLVCNWNGHGFAPYYAHSNVQVGHHAFATVESCYASVP